MKNISTIISALAILLFMGNYSICDYFYYNDVVAWWGLKQNIYNAIIFIFCFLAFHNVNQLLPKTILCFGLMICFANIVDRLFFDIKTFEPNDMAMLAFALIFSGAFYFLYNTNGRKRTNI